MRPDSPSLQLAAGMVGMPVGCWSSISVVALSRWLWVQDEDPTVALSVPAGAGRVTREFLPENGIANDRDLEDARRNIRKILEPMVKAFPKSKHPMHAVGTSKTIRSLARLAGAVVRQPGRVDTST